MPTQEQQIYDELLRRGALKDNPLHVAIGHELRRRGVVTDPTQGGLNPQGGATAPKPEDDPGSSSHDPYGDPGLIKPASAPKTAAPVKAAAPASRKPAAPKEGFWQEAAHNALPSLKQLLGGLYGSGVSAVQTAGHLAAGLDPSGTLYHEAAGAARLLAAHVPAKSGAYKALTHFQRFQDDAGDAADARHDRNQAQGIQGADDVAGGAMEGIAHDPLVRSVVPALHGNGRAVLHNIAQNPAGALLDVATLGEGAAGSALAKAGTLDRMAAAATKAGDTATATRLAGHAAALRRYAQPVHDAATLKPITRPLRSFVGKAVAGARRDVAVGRDLMQPPRPASEHLSPNPEDLPEEAPATTPEAPARVIKPFAPPRVQREGANVVPKAPSDTLPNNTLPPESITAPPEANQSIIASSESPAAAPSPNQTVPDFPVDQLHTDPERFQYKIGSGQGGQTGSLSGAPDFNQDLAGVVHAWTDPADGKHYVVNGHNRLALAQRAGQKTLDTRFLDAKDAAEARTQGALINIAEGQGSALDAAKLFRDQAVTPEKLAEQGITVKGEKARQGMALANLSPALFGQAVRGEMPLERAAIIGEKLPDHGDQLALVSQVDKAQKGGKSLTNGDVSELADDIASGPRVTQTETNLFGDETTSKSTAVERAEVANYLRTQMAQEGGAFKNAAKNAGRLAKGNNVIDADASREIARLNDQGKELFAKLKNAPGPISDILNEAATRLARGENPNVVKSDALTKFQSAIPQLVKSGGASGDSSLAAGGNAPSLFADTPGSGSPLLAAAPGADVPDAAESASGSGAAGADGGAVHEGPAGVGDTEEVPPRSPRGFVQIMQEDKLPHELASAQSKIEKMAYHSYWNARGGPPLPQRPIPIPETPKNYTPLPEPAGGALDYKELSRSMLLKKGVVSDDMKDMAQDGGTLILQKGKPVGWYYQDADGILQAIEIKPEFQRQGIGRKVIGDIGQGEPIYAYAPNEKGSALNRTYGTESPPNSDNIVKVTPREYNESVSGRSETKAPASAAATDAGERVKPMPNGESGIDRQSPPQTTSQKAASTEAGGFSSPAPERTTLHQSAPERTGGITLQSTILPGGDKFVEQDVVPAVKAAAKGIASTVAEVRQTLSPASASPEAAQTARVIRENSASLAQGRERSVAALKTLAKAFDAAPQADNYQFIHTMETGGIQPTPELQAAAKTLRDALDTRRAQVQALGSGKLDSFIENYFPHIWEDPKKAGGVFGQFFGKRPLEGPKSFLKKRTLPTLADGLAAGLKPVTDNPVELSLLKMYEMDRFVMGQKILAEMKGQGLAKFVKVKEKPPEGWTKIDDRIATVNGPLTDEGAVTIRGYYHAPDAAARVLNNHLSPGLRGHAWFSGLQYGGNLLNQAQLGFSAFHLGFTSMDSATSKFALGVRQISRGQVGRGSVSLGKAVLPGYAPITNMMRGDKVLREYMKPGTTTADIAQIVDGLVAGGGRVKMDDFYRTGAAGNFWKALRSGNYPGAAIRAAPALIEKLSAPIMEQIVPRMKLGVFADMARDEMERLPAGASRDDVREAMARAWDSVDNRMGQVVYDNLFWNRTLKDIGLVSTRSLGWNLGTVRELGGGMVDANPLAIARRIKAGDPVVTHRMAYAVALPAMTALYGALYQYLATGQGPQEIKDYFFPRTGKTRPDGHPDRVQLPSYMKDVYAYGKHPGKTVTDKLNPQMSAIADMLENRDFYGTEIRNADDPLVQQVGETFGFAAKQFTPFSLEGAQKRKESGAGLGQQAQSFFGITPAPSDVDRTPAEQMIADDRQKKAPQGAKTQEEADHSATLRDLRTKARSGVNVRPTLRQMIQSGQITPRGVRSLLESARKSPDEAAIGRLSLPEAFGVWQAASPAERRKWQPAMRRKMQSEANAGNLSRAQGQQAREMGILPGGGTRQ